MEFKDLIPNSPKKEIEINDEFECPECDFKSDIESEMSKHISTHITIAACYYHACMEELAIAGSFQSILTDSFVRNNLPDIALSTPSPASLQRIDNLLFRPPTTLIQTPPVPEPPPSPPLTTLPPSQENSFNTPGSSPARASSPIIHSTSKSLHSLTSFAKKSQMSLNYKIPSSDSDFSNFLNKLPSEACTPDRRANTQLNNYLPQTSFDMLPRSQSHTEEDILNLSSNITRSEPQSPIRHKMISKMINSDSKNKFKSRDSIKAKRTELLPLPLLIPLSPEEPLNLTYIPFAPTYVPQTTPESPTNTRTSMQNHNEFIDNAVLIKKHSASHLHLNIKQGTTGGTVEIYKPNITNKSTKMPENENIVNYNSQTNIRTDLNSQKQTSKPNLTIDIEDENKDVDSEDIQIVYDYDNHVSKMFRDCENVQNPIPLIFKPPKPYSNNSNNKIHTENNRFTDRITTQCILDNRITMNPKMSDSLSSQTQSKLNELAVADHQSKLVNSNMIGVGLREVDADMIDNTEIFIPKEGQNVIYQQPHIDGSQLFPANNNRPITPSQPLDKVMAQGFLPRYCPKIRRNHISHSFLSAEEHENRTRSINKDASKRHRIRKKFSHNQYAQEEKTLLEKNSKLKHQHQTLMKQKENALLELDNLGIMKKTKS